VPDLFSPSLLTRCPAGASLHDVAAPVATASRCTVWAILTAEPLGGYRKRAELVTEDGGAHPNEREVTVQAAATGGATIPQHGHRVHEEVSVDVVVLYSGRQVGMGQAYGQR
jgi:hypothetical protein